MKVGDVVKSTMTEQVGMIVDESDKEYRSTGRTVRTGNVHSFQVLWVSQGCSIFKGLNKEWCGPQFLEVISESR